MESDVRGQLMFILTDTEKLCDRQQLRELTAINPVLQRVINALKCQDAKLPLPPGFVIQDSRKNDLILIMTPKKQDKTLALSKHWSVNSTLARNEKDISNKK